jgi:para-aminobenzoate synthetase component 1
VIIQVNNPEDFKQKSLQWASSFDVFCYLDSNNFTDRYSRFDLLLAVGSKDEIIERAGSAFDGLEQFRIKHSGWVTGFFSYDLKNEIELLSSNNIDALHFPNLYFFEPQHLILFRNGEIEVISDDPQQIIDSIQSQTARTVETEYSIQLNSRFSKEEYINTVIKIKEHINRGDLWQPF